VCIGHAEEKDGVPFEKHDFLTRVFVTEGLCEFLETIRRAGSFFK
jgi:hypothetical protein